jgi:hypothetical protein
MATRLLSEHAFAIAKSVMVPAGEIKVALNHLTVRLALPPSHMTTGAVAESTPWIYVTNWFTCGAYNDFRTYAFDF